MDEQRFNKVFIGFGLVAELFLHALINSVTPKLSIAQIEKYFPTHPVMRLSLSFSMINGNSVGTYICGSVDPRRYRARRKIFD